MKIKEFEIGKHCFGEILKVNGIDYEDLNKEDVLSVMNEMFKNNLNKENLLKDCFKLCLEYLEADTVDYSQDKCDQCGNYNHYNKYKCE